MAMLLGDHHETGFDWGKEYSGRNLTPTLLRQNGIFFLTASQTFAHARNLSRNRWRIELSQLFRRVNSADYSEPRKPGDALDGAGRRQARGERYLRAEFDGLGDG